MRRKFGLTLVALTLGVAGFGVLSTPAFAVPTKALPKPCSLVTSADVSTAFAKLDPALQPTSVGVPTPGKPTSRGGFGPYACQTTFQLPNSVGGSVLVQAPKTSSTGCPPKSQPGKKVKLARTKALLEPNPTKPKVVRDIAFPKKGACVTIEIFLSGGDATVPAGAFVDLGKAALAKPA